MRHFILFVISIVLSVSLWAQQFSISGTVKDASTGDALIGASVAIIGTNIGVFTSPSGTYSIQVKPGSYKLEFSYLGYETTVVDIIASANVKKNVKLSTTAMKIDKVVVTSVARDHNVISTELGAQTVSIQTVKIVPVLFGENDVLKTIQLMPGVKSAGEGGSGYYVRGGGSDQNLVLLDDAPIYNASHMMGMFSVFNSDAIGDAKLYKGSMSAEYGGRLSSVLDVDIQNGNKESFHGQGGIGTISSRFEIDGPIQKGKSSFLLAGRRTYADIFLKMARDTALHSTKLHFYDVNYKFVYDIDENDKLSLSGYIGNDVFAFRDMFGMAGGNITATGSWLHLFSPKWKLESSLIFSRFDSDVDMNTSLFDAKLQSGITEFNWKEDAVCRLEKHTIRVGGNIGFHRFSPGKLTTSMLEKPIIMEKRNALELNVYADNSQTINDMLKIQYGIRFSNFMGLGAAVFYDYNDEHEIIDSSIYKKGELINYYPNLEPRLSVNYRIDAQSSIKAAYTRTCQFVHLIQSSTISMPTDYWMPSTNKTKPQTCSQLSVGYFRNFQENNYETSAEVYYKNMQNQIDYENGANLFLNTNLESYLLYGHSRSYGLELYAKKNTGNLTGWISYTLSKTEKQFQGINSGTWYPVRYDRTHDFSIVAMYAFTEAWQASATWVYSTGDAVTYPSGKYLIDGEYVAYYTERNGYRMPAYHRMDIGVTYTKEKKDRFQSQWSFSIYNVYNRKNAYMIYFESVDEENPDILQAVKITLFPIIPSIAWNFSF